MGDLVDSEKTELNGCADNDTSNISSFHHKTHPKGIIEKQLSDELEGVQQKLLSEHNELLKIYSTEALSYFSEPCDEYNTVGVSAMQNDTKNIGTFTSNQSNSFDVNGIYQIPLSDPIFNMGKFTSTSQPTIVYSKEHNLCQISSMNEKMSHSTLKSVFILLQHLIDRSGSIILRTNHLQQFISAISLTKLGIFSASDLQVHQRNLLVKDWTFIDSIMLPTIKTYLRSLMAGKLLNIDAVCRSNTISDVNFGSSISDLRSSQVNYATKYPCYLHCLGITVYNLLLYLTNVKYVYQQTVDYVWCSDHYNRNLAFHGTKNISVVNNRLSVCSSLSSGTSDETDSLLFQEMISNHPPTHFKDIASTKNTMYQTSLQSKFSEKDGDVDTSVSKLSCKSTLVMASECSINHDKTGNLPFRTHSQSLEDCFPSDFSLSDITEFTDIPLEAEVVNENTSH